MSTAAVTNTFTTGSITVNKLLRVNGLDGAAREPWASGRYTVTLHCTRTVNGSPEDLTLPQPTKVITGASSATWSGLPTGATCSATEDSIDYPAGTPVQPSPASATFIPANRVVNTGTQSLDLTNSFGYGGLQISKQLTGEAAAYASAPFSFQVRCTLDGTTGAVFSPPDIQLQRSGSQTTLTSAVIGPIPQGAVCTVTETGTGGATAVTPASKSVTLDPIVAGANQVAGFSNEFRYAGFTVTKAVDDGGAKDAAFAAVQYAGTYGFSASCLFNGVEVVPLAQRNFTLAKGADGKWRSEVFDHLPSGASCTVTETGRAGAASTSVKVSQGATTLVDAPSATTGAFTLATGDAATTAVDFTNHYTTGSLQVTKLTRGAGAALWGGGTFTVALRCSLDNDANASTPAITVYDASKQLKSDESWVVPDLPTGATCALTEPKTGGANDWNFSNATPTVTAGPQAITLTNTFTTGSVKVTKVLRANGSPTSAQPWASGVYPVTLHCTKDFDGDGTAEELTISDAAKSITGAGSAEWNDLPQGATCAVTEGSSEVSLQPQPTASVSAPVTVGATQAGLTLTNDFAAGNLVVHKDITGTGAAWGTGPFVAAVSCQLPLYGTVFSRTVTLNPTAGQTSLDSAQLGPIPFGALCSVTETDSNSATVVTTPEPTVITENVSTGNVSTLTLTNEFRQAGFTVSKTVENGGAEDEAGAAIGYKASSFTASCQFRGVEVLQPPDRSFTLSDKESHPVIGLPTGADCTVTETDAAGAPTTTTAINQGGSPVTDSAPGARVAGFKLTSGDATATRVGFTNSYTTGAVRISKLLAGPGATLWADPSFEVGLRCTLGVAADTTVYEATHTLTTDQPWDVTTLPTGANCVVTESAAGAANFSSITNSTFTVGTGTTLSEVTNTYNVGAIRVSKNLTLDGQATSVRPWTLGSYTVELSCTRPVNGVATPIVIPGDGARRTITGAGSVTYADLPTGATCSVAEVASSPASQQAAISPTSVVVGSDPSQPQAVSVTNDFHTSMLTIRKQLSGAGQQSFGEGPFRFGVQCDLAGGGRVFETSVELSRPAGSSATSLTSAQLGPVPVGSVCEVTETASGGADVTPDPVTLTIAEQASANQATFTNQFSAGTLWLSKELAGPAAAEPWATGATFQVDVVCEVEVDGTRSATFSRRVNIAGGQRVNVTDADGRPSRVPLGSHCYTDEVDAQGAGSSTDVFDSFGNAAVVTSGTPDALQSLELGVRNTYEYAGFTVRKAVTNGGALDSGGHPVAYDAQYGFNAACTLAGRTVLDADFTLTDGGSREFPGLPAGATCVIDETDSAAAVATTAQVTQNGVPAIPVAGTAASFTLQRGWFPLGADGAGINAVAFTNSYEAGAATITKLVTGAGAEAWGAGPFTLRLQCTLDADDDPATAPVTVYDATGKVTRTSPEWQVTKLPTGADCTASETASAGATTAATPAHFVVNNDPAHPVPVELTNDFATGSVEVGKLLLVDGQPNAAQPFASATYQVRLACTRDLDGTVVGVDIPGDDAALGDPADGVRAITGAGSVRYDGLPAGATCTATEVAAGFALPDGQVTDGAAVTVPAAGVADLSIANDYHTGLLQVSKKLAGDGSDTYGDGEFTADVSCTLTDTSDVAHTVYSATGLSFSRATGLTSGLLGPIPVGSSCTVTETASGGADQPAAPAVVTIGDGDPTVATLTNTFNQGAVKVRLGLTLDSVPTTAAPYVTGSYATELTCTRVVNGVTVPVAIPDGGPWTFTGPGERLVTGLPIGAECSVSQTYTSLTPGGVSFEPVPGRAPSPTSSGVVTVAAGDPALLAIVDDFTTSTLTVTKLLTGAGVDDHGDQPFVFGVSCTLAEDGVPSPHEVFDTTVTLSRASGLTSAPIGPIPVGADCVVTESSTGGATVAADPVSLSIAVDPAANAATLTNDFQVGTVTVSKHLTVDGEPSPGEPYASGVYTVELTCTRIVDGVELPVTVPGGSTRTITGAGSIDFTGLPIDADCRVSEPSTSLAIPSDQVTITPTAVVVGADPVTVDVTNDYRTGTMVLRWKRAGVGSGFAGMARFTVECTLPGAEGSVFTRDIDLTPVAGQDWVESEVLGPIPIGASCTVTQHSADGADTVAAPVTVTGDGPVVLAEVDNAYSAGIVAVTKELTGSGADEHRGTTFAIAVTCAATADGPTVGGEVRITGAGTAVLGDDDGEPLLLPAGTHCWAQETDDGGAEWSTVDHDGFDNAAVVTTDDPGTVQVLEVKVTNSFAASDPGLAFTGFGPGTWWLLALGLALLGAGAGLGVWRRGARRPRRAA